MSAGGDLVAAVEATEAEALARHRAGTCQDSEWSCSHCEATVDMFRAVKPAHVTAEQWAEIKRITVAHMDHIIARTTGRCVEFDWCDGARLDGDGHD